MDVKYINPFMDALVKTLDSLGISDVKRSSLKKKNILSVDMDVSSVISLKGNIQGHIALSMSKDTAIKLTSAMMMGIAVTDIDNMVKSAIGELSSMISGMASTMLVSLGIKLQISAPAIILGPSEVNTMETLAIDFETPCGQIELNIGFI